jgi:alcohol dehydrogenase
MVGAVHAIGHACGAVAGVHHGNAMAVLLPHVMRFNADIIAELYAELTPFLNPNSSCSGLSVSELSDKAVSEVENLNKTLNHLTGMAYKFSDLNLKKESFESIADKALNDGAMIPNPKELSKKDILTILENAF